MSSREVTLALFALIFLVAAVLHLLGTRPGSRVPTVGQGMGWAMATGTGRVVTLLFWCWVGWHFFAR
jgi:hypothetical protein